MFIYEHIPRVRDVMYLVDPIWDLVCLQCHLVGVQTLSGGEICMLLGGPSRCSSLWFHNNLVTWICSSGMLEVGLGFSQEGVQSKLTSDVCA